MRDPVRIDRIIELLREVWKQSPDLRLAQLIVNSLPPGEPCPRVFYAEDDVVERSLVNSLIRPTPSEFV